MAPYRSRKVMKKINLLLIVLFFSLLSWMVNVTLAAEKVAWFKSGSNSRFWPVVERIMSAAATDLGMELQIYEFENDPFYMVTLVEKVLEDPATKPDCILIHNFKKRGSKVLQLAEDAGVPIFIFNAGFDRVSDVGQPREKFAYWIGQMLPDDEYAGYLLAQELILKAGKLEKNQSKPIEMVALEGNRTSEASNKRVAGLKRALGEHPGVVMNQYFHSKWKYDLAQEALRVTFRRYPNTSIIWSASESMAIGAIEAAPQQGLMPGKDFVTGGFDLLPENKKFLESGEMAVSVGGHYFEGAWALILIHDYLNGIDFGKDEGISFTTKMTSQTKKDLSTLNDIYASLSVSSLDGLNFNSLSKKGNPKRKKYDFDLESFLKTSGR